jgi:tetratricopeptide (TPR) repeat protein
MFRSVTRHTRQWVLGLVAIATCLLTAHADNATEFLQLKEKLARYYEAGEIQKATAIADQMLALDPDNGAIKAMRDRWKKSIEEAARNTGSADVSFARNWEGVLSSQGTLQTTRKGEDSNWIKNETQWDIGFVITINSIGNSIRMDRSVGMQTVQTSSKALGNLGKEDQALPAQQGLFLPALLHGRQFEWTSPEGHSYTFKVNVDGETAELSEKYSKVEDSQSHHVTSIKGSGVFHRLKDAAILAGTDHEAGLVAYHQGLIAISHGDTAKALEYYDEAIHLNPGFAMSYLSKGDVYYSTKDYDKAIGGYSESIRIDPDCANAHDWLGDAFTQKKDFNKALENYTEAIRVNPKYTVAYINRAGIYSSLDNFEKELADYYHVIQIDPNLASGYNGVAWLLATFPQDSMRNGTKALEFALKACDISYWEDKSCLDTLAAAYAENGEFNEAVKWETKYLESTPSDKDEAERRLTLFQRRQPYHKGLGKTTEPTQPLTTGEKTAVIDDANESVNIRGGPSTNAVVLGRILQSEKFFVVPDSNVWWRVRTVLGTSGYVKSKLVKVIPE